MKVQANKLFPLVVKWIYLIVFTGLWREINSECPGIFCYNNGTAVEQDDTCVCQCLPGFSGVLCDYALQQSMWPNGPYALLMPSTGCPESESQGWSRGYINFTTSDPIETLVEIKNNSNDAAMTLLLSQHGIKLTGPFGNYSFQLNFCFKHNISSSNNTDWFYKDVTVFGSAGGCPNGFDEEKPTTYLPQLRYWWSDGYLPYFEVCNESGGAELELKLCRKRGIDSPMDIHMNKPFIFTKYTNHCVPGFDNMNVEEQTLVFTQGGSQYGNLSFCFYTPRITPVIKQSDWPAGPYAMLMHASGCPEPDELGWTIGYINFTTRSPITRSWPPMYYLDDPVPLSNTTFVLYFCNKLATPTSLDTADWPIRDFVVFGAETGCPDGFYENDSSLELPSIATWSTEGPLPYFLLNTSINELRLKQCKQRDVVVPKVDGNSKGSFILTKDRITGCDILDGYFESAEMLHIIERSNNIFAVKVNISICNYTSYISESCYAEGEFYCNGQCIPREWMCNGKDDCGGLDETSVICARHKCHDHEFYCANDTCIPKLWLCDGIFHCKDGSDETPWNCHLKENGSRKCYNSEFDCEYGQCIPSSWVCDDVIDCHEGCDEQPDNCASRCLETQFYCDEGKCIPRQFLCDKYADCADGSDEDDANCALKCNLDEVYCGDGSCVSRTNVCDGVHHCKDGRDEAPDICATKCSTDEFYCDMGRCIPAQARCDGLVHCGDLSDEDCNTDVTISCLDDLGMTDGDIIDDRISASSWKDLHAPHMARPHLGSWCPRQDDNAPFLEVDLESVKVVGGFIIFNSAQQTFTVNDNFWSPGFTVYGSRAFSVSYAIYSGEFTTYNKKPFHVDTSLDTNQPQNFHFLRPFLARYVRISPLKPIPDGTLCLRIELLGCHGEEAESDTNNDRINSDESSVYVTNFTLVTSPGYPLDYPTDTTVTWKIKVARGGYVRVTVAYFYLHDNKVKSNECDGDKLQIGSFASISSLHNGLTPTFPTDKSMIRIIFTACSRQYERADNNKGFRLIVKREGSPTIWDKIGDPRIQKGHLITHSFLGIITLPKEQVWHLKSYINGGPFILTIQHFNVPCYTGTQMSIEDEAKGRNYYCNPGNQPAVEHRAWALTIYFTYAEDVTVNDPAGFSADFRIIPVSTSYQRFVTSESNSSSQEPTTTFQVCSNVLKKCYHYTKSGEYVDWSTELRTCLASNRSLLIIHNENQLEFLQSWLIYRTYDFYRSGMARQFGRTVSFNMSYVHLGLAYTWNTTDQHSWQDGAAISFSSWDEGEPKYKSKQQCTGLWIDMTTGVAVWRTTMCNESATLSPMFDYASLCEEPFDVDPQVINYDGDQPNIEDSAHINSVKMFLCPSGERINRRVVCDDIQDCLDGADETNCTTERNGTCDENEFMCKSRECVAIHQVCDFFIDCEDGDDEACTFPDCHEGEFRCANSQCVSQNARCDAVKDCFDGSDERSCESCNQETAFSCGDRTCIHKALVCNGVPNCFGGIDEECDQTYFKCLDYWKAGYDQDISLEMTGNGDPFSCTFQHISPSMVKVTSTFAINLNWRALGSSKRQSSLLMLPYVEHGDLCEIKVDEECTSYAAEIATFDDPKFYGTYSYCSPRIIRIYFNKNCSLCKVVQPERIGDIGLHVTMQNASGIIMFEESFAADESVVLKTSIGPIVCTTDYRIHEDQINCGNGNTMTASGRCLYKFNSAGYLDGCDNFKHLENCGTFSCPHGYIKCPSSFCVEVRMICDGDRQCPGGEDEKDCECVDRHSSISIIFDDDLIGKTRSAIFEFARKFYSNNSELHGISYSLRQSTLSVNGSKLLPVFAYTLKIMPVHQYDDFFNTDEPETLNFLNRNESSLELGIYDLLARGKLANVFIVEPESSSNRHIRDVVFNSAYARHLYHIRVSPTFGIASVVSINAKESDILLGSWEMLGKIGSNLFPDICNVSDKLSTFYTGRYRCWLSKTSIPLNKVCDNIKDCDFGDDEDNCEFQCTEKCTCDLYVAICRANNFTTNDLQNINSATRILDISHNQISSDGSFAISTPLPFLIKLFASHCGITFINDRTFVNTSNIRDLDLSFNAISVIRKYTFFGLINLRSLNLNGNKNIARIEPDSFETLLELPLLSITNATLYELWPHTFTGLTLAKLILSNNNIKTIHGNAFNNLSAEELNIEGNPITKFDADIFTGLKRAEIIKTPAFKFCCYKPNYVKEDECWPPKDEFSSCEDLMRNSFLQSLLWVIGVSSLLGNLCTITYRIFYDRASLRKGHGLFVTNLAASDLLMGVYMIIIAIADISFRKRYMLVDEYWRHSFWCNLAGVLATVSSEASVMFMCLVTIDRIFVIRFPFGQWRFHAKQSGVAVMIIWITSVLIAVMPFIFTEYFQDRYYSSNSVCLALPLTQLRPPGWLYSFVINVFLNFFAFILIAAGQLVIYLEIRKSSKRMKHARSHKTNDIRIAKNLLLLLTTDFLCWFPIGVMAIMSSVGYVIPGAVYVWTAVLLLPINSALNPYLYTLSAVLRKQNASELLKDPRGDIPKGANKLNGNIRDKQSQESIDTRSSIGVQTSDTPLEDVANWNENQSSDCVQNSDEEHTSDDEHKINRKHTAVGPNNIKEMRASDSE